MTEATQAVDTAARWTLEIQLAEKAFEKWCKRGQEVVKRYRDERERKNSGSRFNILWSNVQTIRPAVYSRKPKAEVERRYLDHDPVGRVAATLIERALQFDIEYREDFHQSLAAVLDDRLLPGRGVVWVRYDRTQLTDDTVDPVQRERAYTDYVYWEDFLHSPARTWAEVRWVARRVYLTQDQGKARFGEIFDTVPLSHKPEEMKDDEGPISKAGEKMAKAVVWEIWERDTRRVYWHAEGFDRILDERDDPLNLANFWPCPRPLFATTTTDSLVPVPDFCQYQDQAEELDTLTMRIDLLVDACRVAGVYDATAKGISNLLSARRADNVLIPVDSWSVFADKGGVKGTIQFLPLAEIAGCLQQLYQARESTKQSIYEITGMADVIRGASDASETASAQKIKARFASLRLQETQTDMARFASEVLCIQAEIMARFFSPQTLLAMAGAAQFPPEDQQIIQQALQLLKSGPMSAYRIRVASDTLVELDREGEKKQRMEFLAGVGMYLERGLPVVQAAPTVAPLIFELLKFGVRGFPVGRELEGTFDKALSTLPQREPPEIQEQKQALQEQGQKLAQEKQQLNEFGQTVEKDAMQLAYDKKAFDLEKQFVDQQRKLREGYEAETGKMRDEVEGLATGQAVSTLEKADETADIVSGFAKQLSAAVEQMAQAIVVSSQQTAQAVDAMAGAVAQQSAQMQKFMTAKRRGYRDPSGALVSEMVQDKDTMQ